MINEIFILKILILFLKSESKLSFFFFFFFLHTFTSIPYLYFLNEGVIIIH